MFPSARARLLNSSVSNVGVGLRALCTSSAGGLGAGGSWRTLARATIVGYLGSSPYVSTWDSGRRTLSMNLATHINEADGMGGYRSRTQWHRVYVRDDLAGFDFLSRLEKGSLLYVEGNLRNVTRMDSEGRETTFTNLSVAPRDGGIIRVLKSAGWDSESDGAGELREGGDSRGEEPF